MVFLLLLVVVLAVYGGVLRHEFILNWDDNLYVTDNESIRGFTLAHLQSAFSSFYVGNYSPLQIISYMVDYSFWGLKPAGYLLTNLILHGINGFLLYLAVHRITGLFPAAIGSALLFLLHPAQVESVAWISQRKSLLSMFFYLLGLIAYLMYRQESGRKKLFYLLSIISFSAALLTKSAAVIFPGMILLYDVCYEKRSFIRSLPDKVPFIVIAMVAALVTLLSQSLEYGGGGRTSFHGGSAFATLLTMLPVLASYLRIIFWPSGLSAAYAPDIKNVVDYEVVFSALLLALLSCSALYLARRDRRLFFWLALIPLGLFPVSQVVPLITLMNDRYLYYPMVGVAPFLALGLSLVTRAYSVRVRQLVCLISVIILSVLAIITYQRTRVWHDAVSLWTDAVAKTPDSPVAKYSLAEVYFKSGRYADAKQLLLETTTNFPDRAAPYELLGNLFYETGDIDKAKTYYIKALSLKSDLPNANLCLGNIYLFQKNIVLAREKFLVAEKVKPFSPDIAYSLACAESMLNHKEIALRYLAKAFRFGFNGCQAVILNNELDPVKGLPAYEKIFSEYCGKGNSR